MRFVLNYAATHFTSNRKQYFSVIVMMVLSMLLIGTMQFFRCAMEYRVESCEQIMGVDSDNVLLVYTDGRQFTDLPECTVEGVVAFGTYYEDGFRFANKTISSICISSELKDLIKLSIVEGELPKELDKNVRYLLLGNDVMIADIGEKVSWENSFGESCEGLVCGRLEAGSNWLLNLDSYKGQIRETRQSVDQKILCFSSVDRMPNHSFVFVTDKKDVAIKRRACVFLEEKGNRVMSSAYMSNAFSVADVENKGIVRLLSRTVWMVIIVTVLLMACIQTVMALNYRRLIGIWYANGVDRWQVIGVYTLSLIFTMVIAFAIAGIFLLTILKTMGMSNSNIVTGILHTKVIPLVVFATLMMNIIGFILPLYALLTDRPAEMIRVFRK